MSASTEPRVVPAMAAALCLSLTLATTTWAAKPVYGPLRQEFGWPRAVLIGLGLVSLVATVIALPRCLKLAATRGPRPICTLGCLASGLLALLVLPTLTHLWQLAGTLLALGIARAVVLSGLWHELRRCAGLRGSIAIVLLAAGCSVVLVAPWIAQIIYRNSWREGSAACGGLLLLVCAPISYLLLTGSTSPLDPPSTPAS